MIRCVRGFLELDRGEEGRVTAITGVGWTPGTTNVPHGSLPISSTGRRDSHRASRGRYRGEGGHPALIHATGMIPTYIMDVTWVPAARAGVAAFSRSGWHPTSSTRTQAITIPRYINARTVTLKGGLVEGYLVALTVLVKLRLTDT